MLQHSKTIVQHQDAALQRCDPIKANGRKVLRNVAARSGFFLTTLQHFPQHYALSLLQYINSSFLSTVRERPILPQV